MPARRQPVSSFGPPTRDELAYLAGLIDRGGGFLRTPPGIKIRCGSELGEWLEDRFGGRWYSGYWWLRKRLEVQETLTRLGPLLIQDARRSQAASTLAALT